MITFAATEVAKMLEDFCESQELERFHSYLETKGGKSTISVISTDTRKGAQHQAEKSVDDLTCFVTLPGKFTPVQQIEAAIEAGYDIVFTDVTSSDTVKIATRNSHLVFLNQGKDTTTWLQTLAKAVRLAVNPLVIAITGSSGKTSLKDILNNIFRGVYGEQVLATKGNYNNHLGVALTLLELTHEHKVAIVEHGANHAGEIDLTTRISLPHLAAINNVQLAHTEGFGNLEGVGLAKAEIFNHLQENGIRVVNLDSHTNSQMFDVQDQQQVVTVSASQATAQAKLDLDSAQLEVSGSRFIYKLDSLHIPAYSCKLDCQEQELSVPSVEVSTNCVGKHQCYNVSVALTLALASGLVTLEQALAGVQNVVMAKGRAQHTQVNTRVLVIDDTYNANVGSMLAACELLELHAKEQRVIVTGTFAELHASEIQLIYKNLFTKIAQQITANREPILAIGAFKWLTEAEFDASNECHVDLNPIKQQYPALERNIMARGIEFARKMDPQDILNKVVHLYDQLAIQPGQLVFLFKGSNSSRISKTCADFITHVTSC